MPWASSQEPFCVALDGVFEARIGGVAEPLEHATSESFGPLVVLGAGDGRGLGHAAPLALAVSARLPLLALLIFVALILRARHFQKALRLLQTFERAITRSRAEIARA